MKISNLIGKATIHPILFYTGKICGYITWIYLFYRLVFSPVKNSLFILNNIYFLLLIFGIIITAVSLSNLGSSTRLGLPKEKLEFKDSGLYKFSRNPMYVGFNLITISSIVYFHHWAIFLAGVYSILIYHFIILAEEEYLLKRFGEQYSQYKMKVRMYI